MKKRPIPAGRILVLALALLSAFTFISGAAAETEQRALASGMIRLHIIANSDSAEDQTAKLAVRDALLKRVFEGLGQPKSVSEAVSLLEKEKGRIEEIAQEILLKQGRPASVTVSLERTSFSTRYYDDFSLPAGEYLALRVKIGKAEGKNWWCVLFPPLCLGSGVEEVKETASKGGLNEDSRNMMLEQSGNVKFKFRILELIEYIKSLFP